MQEKREIRLGQVLVIKQWCTLRQVNEALAQQRELQARNQYKALGRLLVEQGALSETRLRAALAELGVLRLRCSQCDRDLPILCFDAEEDYRCQLCGSPLVLADPPPPSSSPPPPEAGSRLPPGETAAPPAGGGGGDGELSERSPSAKSGERDPLLGKVLGGCQITGRLARGGMGVVYKAKQLNLNRPVAIKVLAEEFARDQTFVRRFLGEARSAAQLNHSGIVHILDVGEYQGIFYFTMEYIDGPTLKALLNDKRRLPLDQAVDIILQICRALRHAHNRGVVHRDIKPENIMITAEGTVKLADLGLAKKLTTSHPDLTQAGSVLGTPYYMAPEQAKDFSRVDRRSDIYSLGVTLYKMVSGRVPLEGRSPIEVMIKALSGKRPALSSLCEDVPPELETVADRMMARHPDDRYQTVDEVLEALERLIPALSGPQGSASSAECA